MTIQNDSPHLASVLKLRFPGEDCRLLDEVFEFTLTHGGLLEIDFKRPEGASYNPRPARVSLILINDAGIRELQVLAAAMLASIWSPEISDLAESQNFPKDLLELAERANSDPDELLAQSSAQGNMAGIIAVALRLDRARHLHQATRPEVRESWPEFVEETGRFVVLAKARSELLYNRLSSWKSRFGQKLLRQENHG